jgi:hypothetical protein
VVTIMADNNIPVRILSSTPVLGSGDTADEAIAAALANQAAANRCVAAAHGVAAETPMEGVAPKDERGPDAA